MDANEIRILKEYLKEIKHLNKEQIKLVVKYFFIVHLKCIIGFGIQHKITKESIILLKEIKKIMKEEQNILRFLKKNSKIIDCEATNLFLNLIENINDETVNYFYECLEDLEQASELKNELYSKHKKRKFKTLIETDLYQILAASLTLNIDDVKNILEYSDDFWEWSKDKIKYNTNDKIIKISFDFDGNLKEAAITLRKIVDYETLNSCIIQIELLYCIYKTSKKEYDVSNIKVLEHEEIKKYILSKYKK